MKGPRLLIEPDNPSRVQTCTVRSPATVLELVHDLPAPQASIAIVLSQRPWTVTVPNPLPDYPHFRSCFPLLDTFAIPR